MSNAARHSPRDQPSSVEQRAALADLWTRVEGFCAEHGWNAVLFVREDRDQFGHVGVRVEQGGGYSFSSFGDTSNAAIRGIAKQLERNGFTCSGRASKSRVVPASAEAPGSNKQRERPS